MQKRRKNKEKTKQAAFFSVIRNSGHIKINTGRHDTLVVHMHNLISPANSQLLLHLLVKQLFSLVLLGEPGVHIQENATLRDTQQDTHRTHFLSFLFNLPGARHTHPLVRCLWFPQSNHRTESNLNHQ